MSQEETQPCTNCGSEICTNKFDLHVAYCERFIRRCDKCSQPYDKRQESQHLEAHRKEACSVCGQQVQQKDRKQHQKKCISTNECPYCQNAVKVKEFAAHLEHCSSRTEQCVTCQKYLMRSCKKKMLFLEIDKHVCKPVEVKEEPREFKRLFRIDENQEEPKSSRLEAYLDKKVKEKKVKARKIQKKNQENEEQFMNSELQQVIMQSLLEY